MGCGVCDGGVLLIQIGKLRLRGTGDSFQVTHQLKDAEGDHSKPAYELTWWVELGGIRDVGSRGGNMRAPVGGTGEWWLPR